jgi:hypothetical protein
MTAAHEINQGDGVLYGGVTYTVNEVWASHTDDAQELTIKANVPAPEKRAGIWPEKSA